MAAALAAVPLQGCDDASTSADAAVEPATVEKIKGSDMSRLTLEEQAAERLGIETDEVEAFIGEAAAAPAEGAAAEGAAAEPVPPRTAVPYSALLYAPDGETSVYTTSKRFVFVRHPVTVEYIDGDLAVLTDGPRVGTKVVSAGGAELTGIEFGVGK